MSTALEERRHGPALPARNVALIDLLDRLLQGGIVIQGHVILAAAEIDLVKLDLRILVASIDKLTSK